MTTLDEGSGGAAWGAACENPIPTGNNIKANTDKLETRPLRISRFT
jgi:hypothetical protein